jgi:hypothetical protein
MRGRKKLPVTDQKAAEMAAFASNLFTIPEFCASVRISERQYFRLRCDGRGPRVTAMGGKVLITRAAIQEWLHIWTEA